jgi:hypothetical protein
MKKSLFAFALIATFAGSIAHAGSTFQVCADNNGSLYIADNMGNLTGEAASKLDTPNLGAGADMYELTITRGLDPKKDAKLISNLNKAQARYSDMLIDASATLKRKLPLNDENGNPLLSNVSVSGSTDEKIMFLKAKNGISTEVALACSLSMPTANLDEVVSVLNR